MAEVDRVNEKLYDAIGDIEPEQFRRELEAIIADASLTPGVLTVRTATAISETADVEAARRRGVGVQLSYEGLKHTRRLARDEPWNGDGDLTEHDLDFLVAEALVSRGFSYLTHTGVADHAVEIVRRFGRNMTYEQLHEPSTDPSLEVDVIVLAIEAGADLVLQTTPPQLSEYAESFATEIESVPLPTPGRALGDTDDEIRRIVATRDPSPAEE